MHERVLLLSQRSFPRALGQFARSQCTIGCHGYILLMAEGEHLALFLTHNQIIVILHRDKLCPSFLLSKGIHLSHLIGISVGNANITRFARRNGLVHALKDFLGRSLVIPDVVDIKVNIVHTQMLQTAVDAVENMLTTVDAMSNLLVGARQELRGDNHIFTLCHITQGTSHKLFGCAQLISDGCVEEIHPQLKRATDNLTRRLLAYSP